MFRLQKYAMYIVSACVVVVLAFVILVAVMVMLKKYKSNEGNKKPVQGANLYGTNISEIQSTLHNIIDTVCFKNLSFNINFF